MKAYDVNAIREELAELRAEQEALVQLSEKEERELTEEELKRFNAIQDTELPELEKKLETAEKFEALKKESIKAQLPQRQAGGPGSELVAPDAKPKMQFAVPKSRLKCFKGENAHHDAYIFGQSLIANYSDDPVARQNAKQWLVDNGILNAVTTTATVPTETVSRIIEFRETVGATRQLLEVYSMASEFLRYPKLTGRQTVYYPGKATDITASDTSYTTVDLTAEKRAVYTVLANETQADSVVNMADNVASSAAFQLALREDIEFVTGDGTAGFGGVTGLQAAVTTNVVTVGTPAAKIIYVGGFMSGGLIGSRDSISVEQSTEAEFKADALAIKATSRYDIQIHEEAAIAVLNVDAGSNVTMAHLSELKAKIADKYKAGGVSWLMSGQTFAGVIEPLFYAQGGNTTRLTEMGVMPSIFGDRVVFSDAVPTA